MHGVKQWLTSAFEGVTMAKESQTFRVTIEEADNRQCSDLCFKIPERRLDVSTLREVEPVSFRGREWRRNKTSSREQERDGGQNGKKEISNNTPEDY